MAGTWALWSGSERCEVTASAGGQLNIVIAEKAELVGRYAVQITWMDGHSGGICDYALLSSLGGQLAGSG